MKRNVFEIVALFLLAILSSNVTASFAQDTSKQSIIVRGREDVTVTTPSVKLGDIADVASDLTKDDEAVIALRRIEVAKDLVPGKIVTLSASQVLDILRANGVNLTGIGYVLPHVTTVTRAGRQLNEAEIRAALEAYFHGSG